MPQRRRSSSTTPLVRVRCSGCRSACFVASEPLATTIAAAVADAAVYRQERDEFSYVVCASCAPVVAPHEEDGSLVVFTSHVNPSVVQQSSHPDVVPVCPHLAARPADVPFVPAALVPPALAQAKAWFDLADHVLVVAGAGMSADAGLPVYRYVLTGPPTTAAAGGGLSAADVCYRTKPHKAWYYDASIRRDALRHAPHAGYTLLLSALTAARKSHFVLTSNIDGYFLRAGFADDVVYETHGSVRWVQCAGHPRCDGVWEWPLSSSSSSGEEVVLDDAAKTCDVRTAPCCPACGGPARANVSHEADDAGDIDGAVKEPQRSRCWRFLRQFRPTRKRPHAPVVDTARKPLLLVLEVGCGDSVHGLRGETALLLSDHPASGLLHPAARCDVRVVRVDPALASLPAAPPGTVVGLKCSALEAMHSLFG